MADQESTKTQDPILFGPFRLAPEERQLEKAGVTVPVGGRALDLLIVLVERAGEIVTKSDLIARVWPQVIVDEGSLRFHVCALRKALGDGQAGARYVINVPGRGYYFAAAVTRENRPEPYLPETQLPVQPHNLPPRLMRMVGRDEIVRSISARLAANRFVTVVGPGGIGKTTVAVSVGHEIIAAYGNAVHFVELGTLRDIRFVVDALTSALGLRNDAYKSISGLIDYLKDKRMLLILDSCEHVIDAAATAVESIFLEARQIHILATSREPLRVEGEYVHQLFPLDYPPDDPNLTAAEAYDFPAVRLFAERVFASGADFALTDANARRAADICRRLDGLPLAIEIAAGRVQAYGLHEVAAQLDDRFRLSWRGRRTAPPRHQTLNDTLDWSYNLLSDRERVILLRLSVFVGSFSRESAQSVATGDGIDSMHVIEAIENLVAKSLLSPATDGQETRYRLLDTTLVYLRQKLAESTEANSVARRHAIHYRDLIDWSINHSTESPQAKDNNAYTRHIRDVRAAVDWSFSPHGDAEIGTALVATWAPILVAMSLTTESNEWARRAIESLNKATGGSRVEMELQTLLGVSFMFVPGPAEEGRAALARALEIAETLDDSYCQLMVLSHLHNFSLVTLGNYRAAHGYALRCARIEEGLGPTEMVRANSRLANSYFYIGNLERAEQHCRAALKRAAQSQVPDGPNDGTRNTDLSTLFNILCCRGYSDQAINLVEQIYEEIAYRSYPLVSCIYLSGLIPHLLLIGNDSITKKYIDRMLALAEEQDFGGFQLQALAFQGALSIRRGDAAPGIPSVREALNAQSDCPFKWVSAPLAAALAEGLTATGQYDEAIAILDKEIRRIDRDGDQVFLPHILCAKAEVLVSMPHPDISNAEYWLLCSLNTARLQSALACELRSATSLARLLHSQGRSREGRELLVPIHDRFTEGFDTDDLIAAKRLLHELS